jgi:hypothetical protein
LEGLNDGTEFVEEYRRKTGKFTPNLQQRSEIMV